MPTPALRIMLIQPASVDTAINELQHGQQYLMQKFGFSVEFDAGMPRRVTVQEKAQRILATCLRDDVDVLWAVRGGEGTADILPLLVEHKLALQQAKPKLIIGFSDITPFLIFFANHFAWPAVHGPGCLQLQNARIDQASMAAISGLLLEQRFVGLPQLLPLNSAAEVERSVTAQLIGGNLSLLAISIKDCWEFDPAGKIIFIEDVNEKPHVIARSLKYLARIGKFDQVAAIILGDFMGLNEDKSTAEAIERVLKRFAASCNAPVFKTHLFGHGHSNFPLPLNQAVSLQLGPKACLQAKKLKLLGATEIA